MLFYAKLLEIPPGVNWQLFSMRLRIAFEDWGGVVGHIRDPIEYFSIV